MNRPGQRRLDGRTRRHTNGGRGGVRAGHAFRAAARRLALAPACRLVPLHYTGRDPPALTGRHAVLLRPRPDIRYMSVQVQACVAV